MRERIAERISMNLRIDDRARVPSNQCVARVGLKPLDRPGPEIDLHHLTLANLAKTCHIPLPEQGLRLSRPQATANADDRVVGRSPHLR